MRKRFRGNVPIGVSREVEGGGRAPQLYAGKPMFPDPVGGKSENAEWGTRERGEE